MIVVDLHPEELLEKDASGEIDDTERARLEAHLVRCATCRFERQLRADFADELRAEVPAPRVAGLAGLVGDVAASGSGRISSMRPSSNRTRRAARLTWLMGAAAAVLVVGVAAASLGERSWRRLVPSTGVAAPIEMVTPAEKPAARAAALPAPVPAVNAADVAPVDVTPPSVTETAPAAAPLLAANAAESSPHEASAADLFDSESSARRRGDYSRVLELHGKLQARHGHSREAQVSRATVGRLLLDRGDPVGALASFDAYLAAGSGDLGEETMVGRATALDRLGRADEASRAWRALLAAFPETPHAAHARARLENPNGS